MIRLIDAGEKSGLRSQSIYHAVARTRTGHDPDTVVLVIPEQPYISIGYHQELEKEVDVEYCKRENIPVVRREVGGGTVYLDRDQLFVQWVFQPDRLPWRLDRRFELFAQPLINTYRTLGMDAYFRPPNDIHVAGRKIAGLGAGAIGNAEVIVGNFLFDFHFERMSKVLKVPNENFRSKLYQGLKEYITTMKRELGTIPDCDEVKQIYSQECEKILKDKVVSGRFTAHELHVMEQLETRFASDSWLYQKGGLNRPGVKIHSDVWLYENNYRTEAGMIGATLRVRENHIDDVSLSGDFPFESFGKLRKLEKVLLHKEMTYEQLSSTVEDFYQEERIEIPGVHTSDWVHALLMHKSV